MNFRNRKLVITIRTLLGLMLVADFCRHWPQSLSRRFASVSSCSICTSGESPAWYAAALKPRFRRSVASAMTSYLGYAYWEKYKALFQRG